MKILNAKKNEKPELSGLMEYFGTYQLIQCVVVCFPLVLISMININYVFAVGDVEYRCRIQECESENSTSTFPIWWPNQNRERCKIPDLRDGEKNCSSNSFTGESDECNEWIYENNNTLIAELNLACQPWKSQLIGTIHNLGMMLSTVVAGWISDKFGRKPTLIFCAVGGSIGYFKTFTSSYHMYVIVEFFEALATGGFFSAACVLFAEIAGKKHRVMSVIIVAFASYSGEALFGCIAMFLTYWKNLLRVINGPCILFVAMIFCINESPRWQMVCGRIKEAKQIMKEMARVNKIAIDNEEFTNMDENKLKEVFDIVENEVKENVLNVFKSKNMIKRLLVINVCRFTSNFVFYGMLLNSILLPGDKYVNFILSSVMSFPGEILFLYMLNKIGRRIPLIIGFSACGLLSITSAFIPASYFWLKLTFFLGGKLLIAACFTGGITYNMELFPTSVRGSMLGLGEFASRLGGMLAPLTPILNTVSEVLPGTLFGCFSIIAAALLSLTPETKNFPLFDTIEQVENHANTLKATKETTEVVDCPIYTIKTDT